MDERILLILGLLKSNSQHGYQINDFIERNLGRVSDMKKATAYSLLKKLHEKGLVEATTEQEGNRPSRQVYSITPTGEEKFYKLLRQSLVHVDDYLPRGDIGLCFIDQLPTEEVIGYLKKKLEAVEKLLFTYENIPKHVEHAIGVNLTIEHRIALFRCDRDWLLETIDKLSAKNTAPRITFTDNV
ncbi:helix-turn-helix transcriptional regulator [Paenibacillus vini]|uniref:PadR family transcriptional regulator n=1 Tax=Paenibacillus vini TaxID=1476024 RepID=A0ABQ4M567_9BACL|nr:helix-turn-helix transcriptional regulator [Paenibacillus vini]MBQ4901194.1 helix-turn-helix transcriptional regulator [Paenibacillus sp. Marseille-P2973]GIP51097.1 PadR family transcriptional regulator [Paenibacillus vini]